MSEESASWSDCNAARELIAQVDADYERAQAELDRIRQGH